MVIVEELGAANSSEENFGVAALLAQTPVPRRLGRGGVDKLPRWLLA